MAVDPATITTLGTALAETLMDAIKAGKSRQEAEVEAARALERGDVVNDELYEKLRDYVEDTKDFETHGAG